MIRTIEELREFLGEEDEFEEILGMLYEAKIEAEMAAEWEDENG